MPEKTGKKQETTQFQKGLSGNPKGRPKGSCGKSTQLAQSILQDNATEICHQLIEQAKRGNVQAIKIVIDRILPICKERHITVDLPQIKSPSDVLTAINLITAAVSEGKISPSEGEALGRIVDINIKTLELNSYEERLRALEAKGNQ